MLKDTFDNPPSILSRLGSKLSLSSQLLSTSIEKNNDNDNNLQQRVKLDDMMINQKNIKMNY